MAPGKLPSFQFYPGDWLRDNVSGCSLAAQGLWLRMMILAHDGDRYGYLSMNGVALPPDFIARKCGCDSVEQYTTLLSELLIAGVPSQTPEGIIYSRRMVRDAKKRSLCSSAGKKGGGNPALTFKGQSKGDVKGEPKGAPKLNPKASSSSSSSVSTSDSTPRTPPQPIAEAKPDRARSLSPEHTGVVNLLQFYLDEYEKAFKSQPNMPNRKKYQDIQDEIDRIGLDELKRRLLCYFKDPGKQKAFWRFEFFLAIHSEYDSKMNVTNGRVTGTGNTNLDKTIEAGRRFLEKHNGGIGNASFQAGIK